MLTFPDIQRRRSKKSLLAASSLLLLLATQAITQSGRRAVKPAPEPTPITTENPENAPAKNSRQLTQKVSLFVGRQLTSRHLLSEDAIVENFVKRLNEFTNVTATSVGDLDRGTAKKLAKHETEAIVVLLQFDIDNFQSGMIILNSPDLDVRVRIFAPGTGRERFKGKVYYKAIGGPMLKKDNWPTGTPIRMTTDGVGTEAAEQVHDWLVVREMRRKN
jgi:hypothetical protein